MDEPVLNVSVEQDLDAGIAASRASGGATVIWQPRGIGCLPDHAPR